MPPPSADPSDSVTLHASTVALGPGAVLIRGPSGAGKSALALDLIARGAVLVSDDRTVLTDSAGGPLAGPPTAIAGLIEARGLGLLRLPYQSGVPLAAVVDLAEEETERLPPIRRTDLLGHAVPLFRRARGAHFASALFLALNHPPLDPDAP